jgi:ATP-binding cassette subfamily B protein
MLTMVSRAEASAARIFEVLDTEPSIKTAAVPRRAPVEGRVVFDNVSFHYARRAEGSQQDWGQIEELDANRNGHENRLGSEEVLDHASFTVEPGQQIALLGATGSGKSTLVNLIPRFYDVTGGRVLVDGVDVRDWAPDALRSRVGMVMQQSLLFGGTIRENIAYGKPEATLDEVIAAAKAAQAHEFIIALPDGYDSLIEERGSNLSGGQRQRVAIARALLIKPSILIMDDSTSAVDMETEFKIQEALDSLMANRTTFIIAQRISSVIKADQIFILDAGQVVAQGTHRELLQISPIYQEIYESQLGERALNGLASPKGMLN